MNRCGSKGANPPDPQFLGPNCWRRRDFATRFRQNVGPNPGSAADEV